jgi:hypothetical protein
MDCKKKGQATIEYIVLLAVALIIGIVVLAITNQMPGIGGNLREQQSRLAWKQTWPLAVEDYKGTNTTVDGLVLMLRNKGDTKIIVREISANGNTTTITDNTPLSANEARVFEAKNTVCNPAGSTFEYMNVSIKYDVVDGISGNVMRSDVSMIGRCVGA